MTDLHVVTSPSAAASLKHAVERLGLSGDVHCIMDDLRLGPLAGERERFLFWQGLSKGYGDDDLDLTMHGGEDVFAPWRILRERVISGGPHRVLIWASGSGADYVFLRMACHRLADTWATLMHVPVPPRDGLHAVAVHDPQSLAGFAPDAISIPGIERRRLAAEFETIAIRPELLRECDGSGHLRFRDLSVHDAFILENCPAEWRLAARVAGDVMGKCDPRNGLSDMFVHSRLQHLIDEALIESDGERQGLRNYRVRLASS
ncbi:DUF3658 domain-containing protein [Rhizobium sp. LCM 4573]|uniref:DUF3658 domain-containing protein n=1 Tax=Rhizobium sp. LCM 4573 TaxID=1848291 RepID=UPI0008D91EE6|nr:DUF3658 domain-containing protein [Rhizobium sp. LCM 4573]OHV76555.1 hypothetical protein LCM4573_13180 [Rhizobium sp. LCM 4573]